MYLGYIILLNKGFYFNYVLVVGIEKFEIKLVNIDMFLLFK